MKSTAVQMSFLPSTEVTKSDWPADYRDQFWRLYPRKISKIKAMTALEKVHARGDVPWQKIVDAIARYTIWLSDPGVWRPEAKHPATWVSQGCWDDELPAPPPRAPSFAEIGFGRRQ